MADVWRPREARIERRDRSVGTLDGRLRQSASVKGVNLKRRPTEELRSIQFNSSGPSDDISPPYVVTCSGSITSLTLYVDTGEARSDIYVNGKKMVSIQKTGGTGVGEKDDLDIEVDADDIIRVLNVNVGGGSPSSMVTTVNLLED